MSHKIEVIDDRICIHIGTTPVADIYRHIEVMTPDEARAFVADVTAEIESIAPVRIDRWLTPADVEKYGDRWEWWSGEWGSGVFTFEIVTAYIEDGKVRMCCCGKSGYKVDMFGIGDYFTPIKGDK